MLSQTAGTLNTLGTVGAVNAIVAGTQNTLGTVGVVNNIVTGTLAAVTSVTNLVAGTITTLALGTVKQNPTPVGSVLLSTHTLGTGGGTFVGTLVAPVGAGTFLYLSGLSIIAHSGTVDCGIANNLAGTTGAGVYARGFFPPGGGIMRDFSVPINMGTNGTLAYFLITAGTVGFTVNYWVAP